MSNDSYIEIKDLTPKEVFTLIVKELGHPVPLSNTNQIKELIQFPYEIFKTVRSGRNMIEVEVNHLKIHYDWDFLDLALHYTKSTSQIYVSVLLKDNKINVQSLKSAYKTVMSN